MFRRVFLSDVTRRFSRTSESGTKPGQLAKSRSVGNSSPGRLSSQGSPESVPSSGCLAVCLGVGWLPPSRSARSPVTQSSLSWPGARPPREGLLSQTQAACFDMWMLPGLFTAPNCRT